MNKPQLIQTTQRLDDSSMSDAPSGEWVGNIQNSVNLLNDAVSNAARKAGSSLIASGQMELSKITVFMPDPFQIVSTFTNAWVDFGATPARYTKHANGVVEIHALLKDGTIGMPAFRLPVQYRPAFAMDFPATSAAAFASVHVATNGEVTPSAGSNASMSINIIFSALDSSPIIPACWPKTVATNIASVVDVHIANVEDGTTNGQNSPGAGMSVSWKNTQTDKGKQVTVSNILGLPYNRKSVVTLVLVGG